jgi:V/A-type H+/Na+-transporting ATPase subunit I
MIKPKRLVKLNFTFAQRFLEIVVNELQDFGKIHLIDMKDKNPDLKPLKASCNGELDDIEKDLKNWLSKVKLKDVKKFDWLFGPNYIVLEHENNEKEIIKDSKNLLKELHQKYGEIENLSSFKEIKKLYQNRLLLAYEYVLDLKEKEIAVGKFGKTKHTISFSGFGAKEDVLRLINLLDRKTDGKCAFNVSEADPKEKPPTMLSNPALIRPFETLTENFGIPAYDGIDPTFMLAITFTLLFGVMFSDAAYGIILIVLSVLVYFLTKKTTKLVRNLNIVLIYCGLSSVIFGILFGEFLGGLIELKPSLFEPTEDILKILLLSIIIGVVHISLGLVSNLAVKKRILPSLGYLISIFLMIMFIYSKNPAYLWSLFAIFAFLLFLKGISSLKEMIDIVTHIVSYLRVGIMSVAHIIITRLLIESAQLLPKNIIGIFLGILLVLVGILLSFAIGVLIVFLQSLRLHWLEFFENFEFHGVKFEPFKHRREYLYKA